jgi:hypothetical protein
MHCLLQFALPCLLGCFLILVYCLCLHEDRELHLSYLPAGRSKCSKNMYGISEERKGKGRKDVGVRRVGSVLAV